MQHQFPTSVAALALLALAACAGAPSALPANLEAPAGQKLALTLAARGVQIYDCRPDETGTHRWAFVAPQAELQDAQGRAAGDHGAGPNWVLADGTRLVGRVLARADAPAPGAIPWLLLEAQVQQAGPSWAGLRSIQRVHTQGGSAPAHGCNAAAAGSRVKVPYGADYLFFSAR